MLQIITDSSADIPKELVEKYNISVVPLTINIDGKEYVEGLEISPEEFYQGMYNAKNLPKTSQPTPAAFAKVFKELSAKGEMLCLTISSKLSGTFQSACLGKELSGTEAEVFDSLGGSLGLGLQVLRAAELSAAGNSLKRVIEELNIYRREMNILVLLDTLENIVKGGRLSKFQGSLAKILDIKILLEGVEGCVELLQKIRGRKKFLARVLELIGERDISGRVFGITHVDNHEDVKFLTEEIAKRFNPKEIIVNNMGATMGTYAGKGGIIVSF